jgi:hypothetical protein
LIKKPKRKTNLSTRQGTSQEHHSMNLSHGLNNKRKISAPALSLTLLFTALAGSLLVNLAAANPIGLFRRSLPAPIIEVIRLNTDTLTLTFFVQEAKPDVKWEDSYRTIDVSPHVQNRVHVDPKIEGYYVSSIVVWVDGHVLSQHEWNPTYISVSLEGLSNGRHKLEVTASAGQFNSNFSPQASSGVIEFQVDAPPPSISVISQKTFETSSSTANVPLKFTVNKPFSWVGYSLDGNNVVTATHQVVSTERFGTVNCQLVLNHVPADTHSSTVYAKDTVGNRGESEPFSFTVTQRMPPEAEQTSSPFQTTLVIAAAVAAAAAVCAGLLLYFAKIKKRRAA